MRIQISDFTDTHFEEVLTMNNESIPHLNHLEAKDLELIRKQAVYFRVAHFNNNLAGFLIAMNQSASYESENFKWFKQNYAHFVYIDRVTVPPGCRRHGVGRVLYADVQSYAEQNVPLLSCEVNLEPSNDISLLFHGSIGFHEVGQLHHQSTKKHVSLLLKELPAYEYAKNHYPGPA